MRKPRCFSNIIMREINRTFGYNNINMLNLTIKYPVVTVNNNSIAERKINSQIRAQVDEYFRYASSSLYEQAISNYMDSLKNNYPFHGYEAYMEYTVTYNDNCFLSAYADKYEFTGGAHGNTLRTSDTWELCTGESISLYCFFKPSIDYKLLLTDEIIRRAEKSLTDNPGIYFDDYKNLIISAFNPNSFYLSPGGITIYYQQYDIAPYSTGIIEFTIPYCIIGWYPSC